MINEKLQLKPNPLQLPAIIITSHVNELYSCNLKKNVHEEDTAHLLSSTG